MRPRGPRFTFRSLPELHLRPGLWAHRWAPCAGRTGALCATSVVEGRQNPQGEGFSPLGCGRVGGWNHLLLCSWGCLMGTNVSGFHQHVPHCSSVMCPLSRACGTAWAGTSAGQPPVSVWGRSLCCDPSLGAVGEFAAPFPVHMTPLLLCPHAVLQGNPCSLVGLALPVGSTLH